MLPPDNLLWSRRISRRGLLSKLTGFGVGAACLAGLQRLSPFLVMAEEQPAVSPPVASASSLSPADDQLLEELEKLNFNYFWEQTSPQTGLTKDRCNVLSNDTSVVA